MAAREARRGAGARSAERGLDVRPSASCARIPVPLAGLPRYFPEPDGGGRARLAAGSQAHGTRLRP